MAVVAVKKDIRKVSQQQLETLFEQSGEKKFRAKQVYEWIWHKNVKDFDAMSNLGVPLRQWLKDNFYAADLTVATEQVSRDGTVKSAFRLADGEMVEGVLIPHDDRMTACVSSQVGCSLTCKFCATGYMDRKRNLEPGEIYDQVVAIREQARRHYDTPLTNIVFMGMGEPLLNYSNVLAGIDKITSDTGLGMAARRITVSTAGIAKMIKKLGDDQVRFRLAVSLHAANDAKRNQIMPINESNTLDALKEALQYFYAATESTVTYEYIVFKDFNDTLADAAELYEFTRHTPCKVNIIEYNPIAEANFLNTGKDRLDRFAEYLQNRGVNVNIRRSRGKDIDAACGQLANKSKT